MQYDLGAVRVRKRRGLPHWDVEHGIYFVTWHLADAVPVEERSAIEQRCDWYASMLRTRSGPIVAAQLDLVHRYRRRLINRTLDLNLGSCVLHGDAAALVANAIMYFDTARYDLYAWCVMPNHAHVVFSCDSRHALDRVLHSWKSYTANRVNELLDRSGTLWREDYFDTSVRDTKQLQQTIAYVLANPEKAGLKEWPYRASYPERIARVIA